MFLILEILKKRYRWINWTYTLNKVDDKSAKTFQLPSLPEVRRYVLRGLWGYSIDEDQCFNQYPIPPWLQDYCCFEWKNTWYHLNRMAMGWRDACKIAQTATETVMHGAPTSPKAFVDGVCGIGSREEAMKDLALIHERSAECGLKWKEDLSTAEARSVEIRQKVTFVGLELDLVKKTVCLTAKTPAKLAVLCYRLQTAKDPQNCWSVREFVGCVSICFYHAMATAACRRIGRYQSVLQEWARQQAHAQTLPDYGANKKLDPKALGCWLALSVWINEVLENAPVVVEAEEKVPDDFLLITDASREKWCALLVSVACGKCTVAYASWPYGLAEKVNLQRSSVAEPLALVAGFSALINTEAKVRILHVGDNLGTTFTVNKGYSTAEGQVAMEAIAKKWPNVRLTSRHCPGALNPADEPTREKPLDVRKLAAICQTYGVELSSPLSFGEEKG